MISADRVTRRVAPASSSYIAAVAAMALMLPSAACDPFAGRRIPASISKGCTAVDWGRPYVASDVTFGAMIDSMISNQTSIRWEGTGGDSGIVRTVRHDPLTNADIHLDMDVESLPGDTGDAEICREGIALVRGMTLNGDRLDTREILAALGVLTAPASEEKARRRNASGVQAQKSGVVTSTDGTVATRAAVSTPPTAPSNQSSISSETPGSSTSALSSRPIVVDDHGLWCCVTVGQLAGAFNGDGATASVHAGDNAELWLDVDDPRGRWNGLQSFRLVLRPKGPGDAASVAPVSISAGGRLVLVEAADGAISRLIRQSFHLVPPSWPKLDLGTAYNQCLAAAGDGDQAATQRCIDDEMQRREAELNAAYRTKMAVLPPDRKVALRSAERAWLKVREQRCALVPDVDPRDHQNRTYCVAAMDAGRTREIEGFR